MKRRTFLKLAASLMTPLASEPLRVFVPPREIYLQHQDDRGLMSLVSPLGVLPRIRELGGCEGRVLDVDDWDGIGYPVLVENACTFGQTKPRAWTYDFDLWNFRHDDVIGRSICTAESRRFNSHAAWYAFRRFGKDTPRILREGGGWLANTTNRPSHPGQTEGRQND